MHEHREIHAPYAGLRSFEAHETAIFFGREAHIGRLLEILHRERFLAVIGGSGSGKSSLIRAGMLPALALGWTGEVSDWRLAVMRPGDRPLRRLAEALLAPQALGREFAGLGVHGDEPVADAVARAALADHAPLIEAELRRGPLSLVDLCADAQHLAGEASPFNLLVLVDQFEELFRYAEASADQGEEAEAFVNLLLQPRLERTPAALRVHVALTMRTDALNECARFLELPEAINRSQYLTPRLRPEELGLAITRPAQVLGGSVQPEVVTELIHSVIHTPDQLPILQHALSRMWETARERDPERPRIGADDVRRTGGISKVLSMHADSVFASLSRAEQAHADILFRAITRAPSADASVADARRPQRLGDVTRFAGLEPDRWPVFLPVVEAFAADGVNLLTHTRPLDAQAVIDISHEALIRQWARLAELVKIEASQAAEYRHLRERWDKWQAGGQLLSRNDLTTAIAWRQGDKRGATPAGPQADASMNLALVSPSRGWAERYALVRQEGDGVAFEFDAIMLFIEQSEAAAKAKAIELQEARRKEIRDIQFKLDQETVQRNLREELQATAKRESDTRLRQESERKEAAERAKDTAELAARRFRRLSAVATGIAIVAVLAALLAAVSWRIADRSEQSARGLYLQATSLRLAAEGQAVFSQARPGATVDAALKVLAAHRLRPGVQPYFALQTADRQLDQVVRIFDNRSAVLGLAVSPDGTRIAVSDLENAVSFWDTASGLPLPVRLTGHDKWVRALAFSPDGKRIASGGADHTVRLWDVASGRMIGAPLVGHTDTVRRLAFTPDGLRLVSASEDATLRLWDTATGKPLGAAANVHTGRIMAMALSADGALIAFGGEDKAVHLWDARKWASAGTLAAVHTGSISGLAFGPDGRTLVSSGLDGNVYLWRTDRPAARPELLRREPGSANSVAFSPDGRHIASAGDDNLLRLWDAEKGVALGAPLQGHHDAVTQLAFLPQGAGVISASRDDTVRIWRLQPSAERVLHGHKGAVLSVAIRPDGAQAVSGGHDRTLRRWDLAGDRQIGEPMRQLDTNAVRSVAYSPDGQRIVSGGDDRMVTLWDAATGSVLAGPLAGHEDRVSSVAFSPNGKQAVSGDDGDGLILWDLDRRAWQWHLRTHVGGVTGVAFSRDGKRVASAGADSRVRVWGVSRGEVEKGAFDEHEGAVTSVAFGPDDRWLVTGGADQTVRLWAADGAGQIGFPLTGHKGLVRSVASSPDGRYVVSGSDDATVRLWSVDPREPVGEPLDRHGDAVTGVAFGPDGKQVISASADGTLRVWPVLDGWVDALCRKLSRNMSLEEWRKSVGDLPYRRQCPGLPGPADDPKPLAVPGPASR